MDSEAAPVGRTAANGSRTGPNTFTTRPSGRFRLSRTSAPREGANSDRTRTVPSWAMFSTTPSRLMPPLIRPLAMRAYYLTRAEFICIGTGAEARRNDPISAVPTPCPRFTSLTLFKVDFAPQINDRCEASRSAVWVRRNRPPNVLTGRLRCRVGKSVKLVPFEMERWQSTWENTVDFNLSESGVQPIPLRELLGDEAATERFLDYPLAYSQGNGTRELRTKIAAMYHDASPGHVLVTNGSSEANLLAMWHLVERGDEVVVMLPNYMENWGLAQMFGGNVKPLRLQESRNWQFDPDELSSLVTPKTKAIAICNPNNPTGTVMGEAQRKAVLDAARDRGAWLLSDEVYIGAEREGPRTESVWGEHERTLIVNGLSKAYALPGLRIGWVVGPPEAVATLWAHHDYTTLAPTYLSDRLAQIALAPKRREEILARFFFNDTATTEIYTLSLHDALPIFHADAQGLGLIGGSIALAAREIKPP